MILYNYTSVDSLGEILSRGKQDVPCVKLRLNHRSNVSDDPSNIFGLCVLPKCIGEIEKELGVESKDSLMPLLQNRPFMESLFRANRSFDDHNTGLTQFVVSFYENVDDYDLWLRYGDGGAGVSIGLDTDKLKQPFGQVFNFFIKKCVYWPNGITSPLQSFDIPSDLYDEIKEMYKATTNVKVKKAFETIYAVDTPEFAITQRIKETFVHNLVSTYDLFHKRDVWQKENEHRMTIGMMSPEIRYVKNANGDYDPYVEIEIPIDALKIIVIGPKCGKNVFGMIQSLFYERQVKEKIQVLNSNCVM